MCVGTVVVRFLTGRSEVATVCARPSAERKGVGRPVEESEPGPCLGWCGRAARGTRAADVDGRHGLAEQRTAPPTVYDVASAAGVSIATVSRVLRTPDAVREGTRDRVQAAIRTLGYVPSGNARALAGKRTGVVGLLLPGFDVVPDERPDLVTDGGVRVVDDRRHVTQPFSSNLYFDEVLRGAETEAILAARTAVDVPTYRDLHDATHRDSTVDVEIAPESPGPFHFAGIAGRARRYTRG